MNLLNLIEDITTGHDNLRALMQAGQSGQDAVLNIGGETVTLDPMETRWMFGKYKAFNKAGRQEEFLNHLADPVKFDQHMKQLRQLIDKQKNFRGSVPGQRGVTGDVPQGINELSSDLLQKSAQVAKDKRDQAMDPKIHDALGGGYMNPVAKHYDSLSQKFGNRAVKVGQRDAVKKIASPAVMRKIGMSEGESTVEEIAMQDPNNMTAQTRGKLNWENMIRDYMNNKPYTEFEFNSDRPLTVYRTQVYAILKAFGSMKPQNKVNTILNTFGDKMATVEYLDKLRAKGLMPKKVPAYVAPGTEPVPPGQMDLPGMATPKIREADDQKKNPKTTELDGAVNPRVARAMQLARARQSAAGTDTEAMVADFVDQQEKDQAEFNKVKSVNQRQDDLLKQVTAVNQQQDQEIDSLDSDNADLQANLQQLQAVNADLAKKLADVSQRRANRQPEPQAPAPSTSTPAQPKATVEPPLQQPAAPATTATAPPAPAKQKKTTTRKKSSATKVRRPQQDVPNNVLPFRRPEPAVAQDELSAALQGVDMGGELGTGTFGLKENTETLNVGDPVIISGNVEFNGKTGDVVGFGRDQHFVIVDLYNFGKHAFHASNVKYNNYADEEDTIDEMQTKLDRYNVNQPPPGGTNKQREEFLNARDRLFRQMANASPGEKEAIRLKIAELEGQAQSQGVKIRETDDLSRSGYNAIKSLSDWAEKMRVMRELQKDIALMSDPEAKAAVQQRIGDLLKVGIKQGYVKEALNDKAMSVLRSLQQPAQTAPVAIDLNVPEPVSEPAMNLAAVRKRIAQLDELIRMKEQIDRLFVRAQNARGGIYPGLQSDIEDEELYGVPQTDQEYQTLKHKYTKDLLALQKFIAMKKAVYREGQEIVGESSALVRLKRAQQALSQPSQVNEFSSAGGGGSGNYFQELASAWYNGTFDSGSLQKGIKSQQDVERLLQRGIVGPDGVTRKYAIDYNSNFDGVVISSDDYYEHSDYNKQGQEVDSRTGQKWGPNDYMEFSDDDLSEGINEFAPGAGGGNDDGGEDPYGRPQPRHYNRSVDYFSQFEADHFDREDFDDATGVFKGYWGDDQIAYFKFDNPQRNGSDDPGMGWYYEPQNESVAEGKLVESAIFLNPNTVIVGQAHGKPLNLSPETLKKVQAIAAKHGAWYEGNGADRALTRGQINQYVGSWDDEVAKTASPNDPKWLYVLFANVDENNRVQRVGVDPKDTIFNRLLTTAQDNSYQGIGYTAQALQKFLQMASEGKYDFVKMSQQPATQQNLTRFLKAGESLMWPSNWKQYPNRAGKIAKAATVDVRDQYLATRKAGVYVTGSGHLKAVQNITGKQGVAEGSSESVSFRDMVNVVDEHYPKYYAELSGSDISDKQFERAIVNAYKKIMQKQGVAEGQTDYQKRRQRERDVDAGKPVARQPKNPQSDYARTRAKQKRDQELGEQQMCPKCGGPSFSDLILAEKQDACYHKVRSRYKVWPSAYASGALVQCRKKGAANWGNKKK